MNQPSSSAHFHASVRSTGRPAHASRARAEDRLVLFGRGSALELNDLEAVVLGREGGHRPSRRGEAVQDEAHADEAVAGEVDGGPDDAAVALAADHRVVERIPSATFASPTFVRRRRARGGRPWRRRRAGREVATRGPSSAAALVGGEDELSAPRRWAALLVHDREAVAVHVLGEAHVGAARSARLGEGAEVSRHRLRRRGSGRRRSCGSPTSRRRAPRRGGGAATEAAPPPGSTTTRRRRPAGSRADAVEDGTHVALHRVRDALGVRWSAPSLSCSRLVVDVEELAARAAPRKSPSLPTNLRRSTPGVVWR